MKHARLWIVLLTIPLMNCAYNPVQVVSLRYKPSKAGTLALDHMDMPKWAKLAKENASSTMKRFCAPQLPEIVEISNQSTAVGATTTPLYNGAKQTSVNFSTAQFVHFQCVDSVAGALEF